MWFNILKDSKQVSRTMGSIDWENEEIPEKEQDDSCLPELIRLVDKAKNHPNATNVRVFTRRQQDMKRPIPFPKHITCAILKELKELKYSKDDPTSYNSMVKIIGEREEEEVAIYATFSPRGFFFTANGVSDIQSQIGLEIVLTGGYGEENDFR